MPGSGQVLLSFEVQDTGIGIAPEDQERIFEPFVQVGNKLQQKGTGLGLTITRQFAAMLGGSIRVTSAPGKGSLFHLEIPAQHAEPHMVNSVAREREYVLDAGQPEYRILVVDDAPENRELLRRLLHNAGFLVRVAGDGMAALDIFQSWQPHFIWMDLRMPGVDGIVVARLIRALDGGQQVKIAAVTASHTTDLPPEGMVDVVGKPYHASEIFECLARHLGARYRAGDAVPVPAVEPAGILHPETLTALPVELRVELTNALLALKIDQVTALVKRVSELDPALGSTLKFHADRLAFSELLEALDESNRSQENEKNVSPSASVT
jgi:CheY-like chemotaxis protein